MKFYFKKIGAVIVITAFIVSFVPVQNVSATQNLRNPQAGNAPVVGRVIGGEIKTTARAIGNITEQDCVDMIEGWDKLIDADRKSVIDDLNEYSTRTGIVVKTLFKNMVDPESVPAAEPKGNISPVMGADLTLASARLAEYKERGKRECQNGRVRVSIAAGGPGARLLVKKDDTSPFPDEAKELYRAKGILSKPTMPVGPTSGKGCVTYALENLTAIEQETGVALPITIVQTRETEEQLKKELELNGTMVNLKGLSYSEALVKPVISGKTKKILTTYDGSRRVVVYQPGGTLDAFKPFRELAEVIKDEDTILILYGDDPILGDKDFIYSVAGARAIENVDVMVVTTPKTSLVRPFGGTVLQADNGIFIVECKVRRNVSEEGPYADSSRREEYTEQWRAEEAAASDEKSHKNDVLGQAPKPNPIKGLDLIEANMLWGNNEGTPHLSFHTGVLAFSGRAAKAMVAILDKFPLRMATNRQTTIKLEANGDDLKIDIAKPEEYLTDALGLLQDSDLLQKRGVKHNMKIIVAEVDDYRYGATKTWGKVVSASDMIAHLNRLTAQRLGIAITEDSKIELGARFMGKIGTGVTISNGAKVYIDGNATIGNNVRFEGPGIVHLVENVNIGNDVRFVIDNYSAIRVVASPKESRQLVIGAGCTLNITSSGKKRIVVNVITNIPEGELVDLNKATSYAEIFDADTNSEIGALPFSATQASAAGANEVKVQTLEGISHTVTTIMQPSVSANQTIGTANTAVMKASPLSEAAIIIGQVDPNDAELLLTVTSELAMIAPDNRFYVDDFEAAKKKLKDIENAYIVTVVINHTGENITEQIKASFGEAKIITIKPRKDRAAAVSV